MVESSDGEKHTSDPNVRLEDRIALALIWMSILSTRDVNFRNPDDRKINARMIIGAREMQFYNTAVRAILIIQFVSNNSREFPVGFFMHFEQTDID